MADKSKPTVLRRSLGKKALVAAVIVVILAATAVGADYAVNHSDIRFFDTLEAMVAAHELHGRIINEYYTGEAYADRLVIEGFLDWDISSLSRTMTPDEGGQIVLRSRSAWNQKLMMADALVGYTTSEGKRFHMEYKYETDTRYMESTEYMLSSVYDNCYICTTADRVEVLLQTYDGQVWASAADVETGNAISFYTTGYTAAEMEGILDGLMLSTVMNAGS